MSKEGTYEFEERAAILHFDGGMTKQAAEEQAEIKIWERIQKQGKQKGSDV